MKKAWIAGIAAMGFLWVSNPAQADVFSITADVPVQLNLKLENESVDNSVSGFKVGASLPFLIGFGYESYKATLDKKDFGAKADLNFQIVDVFLNLPIPFVNLVIGAGAGSATLDPSTFDVTSQTLGAGKLKFQSAPVTQYFVSVGIPIAVLFDLHLGYHVLSGKFDSKSTFAAGSAKDSTDLDATMLSLGAKIGF